MVEPMLLKSCKDRDLKKYEGGFIAQQKHDGNRIIAIKKDGKITLNTRSGKNELSNEYPDICAELSAASAASFILDGELVFFRKFDGREEFLTGLAVETRKEYDVRYIIFDVLEFQGVDVRLKTQEQRSELLYSFFDANCNFKHVFKIITHHNHFDDFYHEVIRKGGEGIVLKKKTSIYKDGKRSADWLKIKKDDTADCFIVGLMEGDGKYEHQFGSLILAQYNKDSKIQVICNCSGMPDAIRTQLYQTIIKEPWHETFESSKGELSHIVHKCAPKIVVEISFMERLPSGSVRHPRFERIREDKQPKDCTYEG